MGHGNGNGNVGVDLRALIVDGDAEARDAMREALTSATGVEVVGACADGEKAIERIGSLEPDLVTLEIELGETGGFGVIETIGRNAMPATVMVSSDERYAVRAFEFGAVHYLLKPLDGDRVGEAVRRARRLVASFASQENGGGASAGPPFDAAGRFVVRGRERIQLVAPDRIDWIEAYGNYVRLHEGDRSHVVRATLSGVAERLDGAEFARIHRSTIVRVDRVTELVPWFGGDYEAVLGDETRLKVSRRYKANLLPDE